MIAAVVLDSDQIESVAQHLDQCMDYGAASAVLILASDEDERKIQRFYEEYQQGDPPTQLPKPRFVYLGPIWVIGTESEPSQMIDLINPRRLNGDADS